MGLVKCSRCELNYMEESEKMCQICKKELEGEAEPEETLELCPECNEHPVIPGEELCLLCLREKIRQESRNRGDIFLDEKGMYDEENADDVEGIEADTMDEEEPIPLGELKEIDRELGGDSSFEDEEEKLMDETLENAKKKSPRRKAEKVTS
ncbi:MAG: hypothetical protein ACOX6S_03245 [Clostridia bacterium]|jgi:hypothetical protein